jgi:hydroxymethylpyrimidine pyrophosphatase-like HAD family hydrolase
MPRLIRVTFDYDDTLTEENVRQYASELKERGFDVWVVTARTSNFSQDVYSDTDELGIARNHVIFTEGEYKQDFIREIAPIFHVDDDHIETVLIRASTRTVGVRHSHNPDWMDECEAALVGYKDKQGFALTPGVQAKLNKVNKYNSEKT